METLASYYYAHSFCGRVRFIAVPFGYGPRIAAENLAKKLGLKIGSWQLKQNQSKFKKFKLTFNFGVPYPRNEPETFYKVWVDCLMWLRDKLPEEILNYDIFLAKNFFDTNPSLYNQVPSLYDIPPLINDDPLIDEKNDYNPNGHIVVSFGGIETPFTTDTHRYVIPELVIKTLATTSKKLGDKRKIICCCPSHIIAHIKHGVTLSSVLFCSPSNEKFLNLLKQASLYVVQPGLYGPFEAFKYRIPLVFTTPFSYTQICQAVKFEEYNFIDKIPCMEELKMNIEDLSINIYKEDEHCFALIGHFLNTNIKFLESVYRNWTKNSLLGMGNSLERINSRYNYAILKLKKPTNYMLEILKKLN